MLPTWEATAAPPTWGCYTDSGMGHDKSLFGEFSVLLCPRVVVFVFLTLILKKSALLYIQANAAFSCALLPKSIVHAMKILKISNYKQEQVHLEGVLQNIYLAIKTV